MKKSGFLLCLAFVFINNVQAGRISAPRQMSHRRQPPMVRILETSYLIQQSQQTLDSVDLILRQAHDVAQASACGSYSIAQREQMDKQYQQLMALIDPMVELSEFNGQSLLMSDGESIMIRLGRRRLCFESTDITQAGLNLEDAALPADWGNIIINPPLPHQPEPPINPIPTPDPPSIIVSPGTGGLAPIDPNAIGDLLDRVRDRRADMNIIPQPIPLAPVPNPGEVRMETFLRVRAAVRKIKTLQLQFADYHNTLCWYLPFLEPDDREIAFALDVIAASKEKAESIKEILERDLELANESIAGDYSHAQRTIMNAEFTEVTNHCTFLAENVYYGMGIIDGRRQLTVNISCDTYEFDGFDLTTAGLGLDGEIRIDTPEKAQQAIPYITAAIESVQQAIDAMTDYEDFLSID